VLTQCPNCDTTFRVTSEILRVAGGQVRCGRCETQFDALERLIEEDELAEEAEEPDAAQAFETDSGDLQLSEPDLDEEQAQLEDTGQEDEEEQEEWVEFDDIEAEEAESDLQTATDPGDFLEEPAEETEEVLEEEPEEEYEAAVAPEEEEEEEEEEAQAQEYEEDSEQQPLEVTRERQIVSAAGRARSSYAAQRRIPPQPASGRRASEFDDTDQFELIRRPMRMPSAALWKYLAIPLGVLFLFQVFNYYSAVLARNPRFGNAVSGVYRVLGVDLIPDWNLRAYDIKSYRVTSDPATPGTLRVRATIRNRAAFPQPYPLLKLVLEDRYGEAVRSREFEPIEYLDKPPPPDARLAPLKELTGNLVIVDPGSDAAGFRFDICLRGNNGPVCGEDLPVTSP
jgi:predicted Zn finger-like uncharacterized protein